MSEARFPLDAEQIARVVAAPEPPPELASTADPRPRRMAQQLQDVLVARGVRVEDAAFLHHATLAIEFVLSAYVRGLEHLHGQLAREIAWGSLQELPAATAPVTGVEQMVRAGAFHAYAGRNSLQSAMASAAWPSDMAAKPEEASRLADPLEGYRLAAQVQPSPHPKEPNLSSVLQARE